MSRDGKDFWDRLPCHLNFYICQLKVYICHLKLHICQLKVYSYTSRQGDWTPSHIGFKLFFPEIHPLTASRCYIHPVCPHVPEVALLLLKEFQRVTVAAPGIYSGIFLGYFFGIFFGDFFWNFFLGFFSGIGETFTFSTWRPINAKALIFIFMLRFFKDKYLSRISRGR